VTYNEPMILLQTQAEDVETAKSRVRELEQQLETMKVFLNLNLRF